MTDMGGGALADARSEKADERALRAVVADDSVFLREGIVKILEDAGVSVVGQAGDAEELIRKARSHKPDVVVVDVRMPPSHTSEGLEAAKVLRAEAPDLAVLVLSQYVEAVYTADLLGGDVTGFGYLMKDRVVHVNDFLGAFRRVAGGGSAIDPQVVSQMLSRSDHNQALDGLTRRERETLELMAEGLTNTAIAARMTISRRAVERYVGSVFEKLEIPEEADGNRRVLAVLKYLQRG